MLNILNLKTPLRGTAAILMAATVASAGLFYSAPAPALTVYCSNCGNWWTQALEKVEQVNTQLNTAQQLQNSLKQALTLPDRMYRDVISDLRRVNDVYNNTRAIGRDMANMENDFKQQYKGYDNYLTSVGGASSVMPGRYEQWASSGLDNARTALTSAGINVSSFDDENRMLDGMLTRSSSAAGRMQAVQAGNEIAAQNVQQLQKLRDMMQTQISMQANYMATQTERQAVDDAEREKFMSVRPTNSAVNKEF